MSEIYRSCDQKLNAWGMEHKKYLKLAAQLLVFLSPVLFASKNLDNDVWFLLNSGRYISENGFTRVEPFSIYKDLKFSFQQWLTDILFYRIYMQWGITRGRAFYYGCSFYVLCWKLTFMLLHGGSSSFLCCPIW